MITFVIKTKIKSLNISFKEKRHKNCSVICLSQSYYKTDKNIRLNCDHFILNGMSSIKEENMIGKETGVPMDKYKKATK